jgi:hypothetical protein
MTILFQINAHKNPFNGVCIQKQALKDAIFSVRFHGVADEAWRQKEAVGADHLLPTVCEGYLQGVAQEAAKMGIVWPCAKVGSPAIAIQYDIVSFLCCCGV